MTAVTARPGFRLSLLVVLFYAGWIKFAAGDTDVYLIDYAQRALIIALGWAALNDGFRRPLPPVTDRVWLWALGGAAAIIAVDTWTGGQDLRAAFDTALFPEVGFPPLENEVWQEIGRAHV